ncbi:MAG TPA: hypothetical protein VM598_11245 [Bdellovibrionota bacterium]|nr:hypothetical protein [Bdellovibrionota bacterium]
MARLIRSRTFQLFRVLIPSWRFFDVADPMPVLEFRLAAGDGDLGPWTDAIGVPYERKAWQLFWNATENERLARHSLVRQLLDDVNDAVEEDISRSVSYELVRSLVLDRISRKPPGERRRFQFRMTLGSEEILLSPEEDFAE